MIETITEWDIEIVMIREKVGNIFRPISRLLYWECPVNNGIRESNLSIKAKTNLPSTLIWSSVIEVTTNVIVQINLLNSFIFLFKDLRTKIWIIFLFWNKLKFY